MVKIKGSLGITIGIIGMGALTLVITQLPEGQGNENLRDYAVDLVTLVSLVAGIIFYKNFQKSEDLGWVNFAISFILYAIAIIIVRFFDTIGNYDESIDDDVFPQGVFKAYTQFGERLGMLFVAIICWYTVDILFNKTKKEIGY